LDEIQVKTTDAFRWLAEETKKHWVISALTIFTILIITVLGAFVLERIAHGFSRIETDKH